MTGKIPQPPEPPVELRMLALILGFMATPAIAIVAWLGIADLVAAAPRTVDELARETKPRAPSLRRLLRVLTCLGIFLEDTAGKYRHTALSETLRTEAPRSLTESGLFAIKPSSVSVRFPPVIRFAYKESRP
jgi:C-methyltransferase